MTSTFTLAQKFVIFVAAFRYYIGITGVHGFHFCISVATVLLLRSPFEIVFKNISNFQIFDPRVVRAAECMSLSISINFSRFYSKSAWSNCFENFRYFGKTLANKINGPLLEIDSSNRDTTETPTYFPEYSPKLYMLCFLV